MSLETLPPELWSLLVKQLSLFPCGTSALARTSRSLRVAFKGQCTLPKSWTNFRRAMYKVKWSQSTEGVEARSVESVVGLKVKEVWWLGRYIDMGDDRKIGQVAFLALFEGDSKEEKVLLKVVSDFSPKEKQKDKLFGANPELPDTKTGAQMLFQDHKGSDNSNLYIGRSITDMQILESREPSPKKSSLHTMPRCGPVSGTTALRITYENFQESTNGGGDGEPQAKIPRLTTWEAHQYISFVSSEGHPGSMNVTVEKIPATKVLSKESILKKAPFCRHVGEWKVIESACRLIYLPSSSKLPIPAPKGQSHCLKKFPMIPGLNCRLMEPARISTNWIYDQVFTFPSSQEELLLIPMNAMAQGNSRRADERVRSALERRKRKAKRDGEPVVPLTKEETAKIRKPNVRGVTLILRITQTQNPLPVLEARVLPCKIINETDDPTDYRLLLKRIACGFHCWPELWCRYISEMIKSPVFTTSIGSSSARFDGKPALWLSFCIVTDLQVRQRQTPKVMAAIRKLLPKETFVLCPVGKGDSFRLCNRFTENTNNLVLVINYAPGRGSLVALRSLISKIVEEIIPGHVRRHQCVDGDGSPAVGVSAGAVKVVVKNVNGFTLPLGIQTARFLQSWGRRVGDLSIEMNPPEEEPTGSTKKEKKEQKRQSTKALVAQEFDYSKKEIRIICRAKTRELLDQLLNEMSSH